MVSQKGHRAAVPPRPPRRAQHRTFEPLEPRLLLASQSGFSPANINIPDQGNWVSSPIVISGAPADAVVTAIDVSFKIVHTYAEDLAVDLNADAAGSLGDHALWRFDGGSSDNPSKTEQSVTTFNGLSVNRTWYLYAIDTEAADVGYIDEWSITVYYGEAGRIASVSSPTLHIGEPSLVTVRVNNLGDAGDMLVEPASVPAGWTVSPPSITTFMNAGTYYDAEFTVTPPASGGSGTIVWRFYDVDPAGNDLLDTRNQFVSAAPPNGAPTAPSNLSAPLADLNQTSARVVWQPSTDPEGDAVTYEVEYAIQSAVPEWTGAGSTTSTSLTLSGLTENKLYTVRVRARDAQGALSAWTELDPAFRATSAPAIKSLDGAPATPDPNRETWLVLHGRNGMTWTDSDMIYRLAGAATDPDRQVLVVDWSGLAAGDSDGDGTDALDFGGEQWITPMADWLRTRLETFGFTGAAAANLNFIGHSWGAVLAAETATRLPGGVNTLLALDPAEDAPVPWGTAYTTEQVRFADATQWSWAFYSRDGGTFGISAGSETTPPTADESFIVRESEHSALVSMFTEMLEDPASALSRWFGLDRLRDHLVGPWQPDRFSADGLSGDALAKPYEAVIRAAPGGTAPLSMTFLSRGTGESITVLASATAGDTDGDARITASDYFALDRGRALRLPGYANGDFDYSGGAANADDYMFIDRAFLDQQRLAAPAGAALAVAAPALLFGDLPIGPDEEPPWDDAAGGPLT